MTTQFLSKTNRDFTGKASTGPGSYDQPSSITVGLPGFAAFATSSKRTDIAGDPNKAPAPGAYDIATSLINKKEVASSFRSKIDRFKDEKRDAGPDPSSPRSSFKNGKPKTFVHANKNYDNFNVPKNVVPSIPTRYQSYGYEPGSNGKMFLQSPVNSGYAGTGKDMVGPMDYDPKVDVKFRGVPKASFAKGPDRDKIDKLTSKLTETPGPGYYNSSSPFEMFNDNNNNNNNSYKRNKSSVFLSNTLRDSVFHDIQKRRDEPGPGFYRIPSSIDTMMNNNNNKPVEQQFFASAEVRFRDPTPMSQRMNTAPGLYNPITSDFDKLRLKIMKQKKMSSRSGWAQNIAFTTTDSRFHPDDYYSDVPPPTAYNPKESFTDHVKKQNVRSGPFGSKDKRFKDPKPDNTPTQEQIAAEALNRDIAPFLDNRRSSSPTKTRPKYSSMFAPNSEDRFRPVKTPPGPPPGAYNTSLSWKTGAIVMAPCVVTNKKVSEQSPGPGQYTLPITIGQKEYRNPKQVLISTCSREEKFGNSNPGPGTYNVPLYGNMLIKSHNILLASNY